VPKKSNSFFQEGNTMDIKERVAELKKKRNAVIVAHHYAPVEVHEVADVLSDSRGFVESIKNGFDADVIVVIAPTFFAEVTASVLPDKIVLVPLKVECPVASHRDVQFDKVSDFKALHSGIPLVCYATSPFQTKLLADAIALPGEVVQTIESINADEVIFVGEKNCGEGAAISSAKKVILYPNNPICNVYNAANIADVRRLRKEYPDACLMVHPECKPEVCEAADHVIGTGAMYNDYINADNSINTYILGSELGFYLRMRNEFPDKKFIHLSPYLHCNVFKVFRIETICDALENMKEEIQPDKAVVSKIAPLFSSVFSVDPALSDPAILGNEAFLSY
jgi:quinolinate synthase